MENITCGNNSGVRLSHYLVIRDTESGAVCVYVKVTLTEGIVLSNFCVLTIFSINFVDSLLESFYNLFNSLNTELNPICYLLALLAHHFLHVSRLRVKSLTIRLLMSYIYIYIYMEHLFLMFLDHTQRRSTVGRTPLDE